jgi:hypothetical protein
MRRIALIIAVALVSALLHAGFVSALPEPASSLHLPMILVIGLIATFRFADAFAAALAAGITLDALSSLPFGVNLLTLVAATALAILLFTRVFTNHSWIGLLGMNAACYLLLHGLLGTARLGRAVFAGWPAQEAVFRASPGALAAGVATQIFAVIIFAFAVRRLKGTFSAFFITR